MSGFLSIDIQCIGCGRGADVLVQRDRAPDVGAVWDGGPCPECGSDIQRVPSRPNPTRASYVDGKRRFDHLRTQDRLDRALSEARTHDDRKKILIEKDKASGK